MTIETSLNFSVAAFNWLLPADHTLYKTYQRSVSHASISNVTHSIQRLHLCAGVPADVYNLVAVTPSSNQFSNIVHHTVPHNLKSYEDGGPSFQTTVFLRSHNCEVLCECSKCTFCEGAEKSLLKNRKAAKGKEPAQPVRAK